MPDEKNAGGFFVLKGKLVKRPMIVMERIPGPFASLYEKATRMVKEIYYAPLSEEVVSHLREGRILDIGTGPGYLPIEIVKRSPRIRVDGIDLCRRLIETARRNASEAGVDERLHFEVGDASGLKWEDETYDMVISTGMLHMLRDPVGVLRECRRVLKPGGSAWIYDPARVCSQIDIGQWKASFTFRERVLYGLFVLFAKFNPGRVYDPERVVAMIEAAGFREYSVEEKGGEVRAQMTK